jgi:hypothetical protein
VQPAAAGQREANEREFHESKPREINAAGGKSTLPALVTPARAFVSDSLVCSQVSREFPLRWSPPLHAEVD